ncbi:hypothetical protein RRF57_008070 [Xylaria bambusicola]|uniref:Uncharacterized protein n=1 Tax=Xylaria bambusicola TaxID=326684 RepID=A0AAN7UT41_9PEZI
MAASETRSCSSRASWMFTDPYVYQYSDIDVDADASVTTPGGTIGAALSTPCELEGSDPRSTIRYELPANSFVASIHTSHHTKDEQFKATYGLSRNRSSNSRISECCSDRGDRVRTLPVYRSFAPSSSRVPPQPPISGLIPVVEDASTQYQHYHMPAPTAPPRRIRPSPPGYADGLIPVDANAMTPKEPSSDFDAILRNIGPIPKKVKGSTSRERSSRYFDRYSSNFG